MNLNINILCALSCEAKPLIDHLKLKKIASKPFAHYRGSLDLQSNTEKTQIKNKQTVSVSLAISGSGQTRMAAATAWLGAITSETKAVWLNVGTAGHVRASVGNIYRIYHVSEEISERQLYPPMTAKWRGEIIATKTLAAPTTNYPNNVYLDDCLDRQQQEPQLPPAVDMEAYAFFSIAQRFADAELVQALKVISDNAQSTIEQLDAKRITQLIQPHNHVIIDFLRSMLNVLPEYLSYEQAVSLDEQWIAHLHCSVSQRHQYQELMRRLISLRVFCANKQPEFTEHNSMSQLLTSLQTMLDEVVPDVTLFQTINE